MDYSINNIRKDEKGFTLVELAVVMIIIGLLIGGILKGQELITNARVTSTIGQMEGLSAAYHDFRNQYNALPGDLSPANAAARIGNCAAIVACNQGGDGNGQLASDIGAAAAAGESTAFFGHLLAAGYITGMDGTIAGPGFGLSTPSSSVEGGFLIGDTREGVAGFNAAEFRPGIYLVQAGDATNNVGNGTGTLTGQQAASIDRRLDDGIPSTGSIVGDSGALCRTAVLVYNQAATNSSCSIAYRM